MNLRTFRRAWLVGLFVCTIVVNFGCGRSGNASQPKTQWADPKTLSPGPIQHASLSDEQMGRVTRLHKVFLEVDPTPLDKWAEDFRRDINPDDEIKIWKDMAVAYEGFTKSKILNLDAKKEVFQVVLLRSSAPEEEVIAHLKLKVLTEADAREIMKLYPGTPKPIGVVKP